MPSRRRPGAGRPQRFGKSKGGVFASPFARDGKIFEKDIKSDRRPVFLHHCLADAETESDTPPRLRTVAAPLSGAVALSSPPPPRLRAPPALKIF